MRFWVTLGLGLLVLGVFLTLGSWQWQRLNWKQAVLADIDARIAAAPVSIPQQPDPVRDSYLPVTARGVLGDGVQVLASTRDHGPGYRIIRVLKLDGGRKVMVDLGFLPLERKADLAPGQQVDMTGNLHWPDEVDTWTPAPEPDNDLWFARDVPVLAEHLGTEPILIIARSVTPPSQTIIPLPITGEGVPNRHLEYVITWFSFALIWSVMTGVVLWRIRRRTA